MVILLLFEITLIFLTENHEGVCYNIIIYILMHDFQL